MQNMVLNMCEKFHSDRLRNDRALGNGKSDNNKKKNNNVGSAWRPDHGSTNFKKSYVRDLEKRPLEVYAAMGL